MNCNSGTDVVLLASSLAILIAGDLNVDDINILGSLFNAIGDNLAIIAAKKQSISQGNT
ncbi:MAG: hypothetical protein BWY46_01715 [Firmicutes bacterium ADurb.Bin300]|jgi:hypothetical protein|nr:MAG: hypothetical protein BWY46_01715 [Firmicutes bacterium ADurb.Bin300]